MRYRKLSDFLLKERGFSLTPYKENYILRRLESRLNIVGLPSLDDYIDFLKGNENEINSLLNALTINLTYFFRNAEVFEYLTHSVLPNLIEQKIKSKEYRINIWSAGCATGEEPYSIACLLLQNFDIKLYKIKINILATDVDSVAIKRAEQGVYQAEKLAEVDKKLLLNCFRKSGNSYHIKEELRDIVEFRRLNLLDCTPLHTDFDIITCRNVLIYFSRPYHLKTYEYFLSHLNQQGILILGKAEMLISEMRSNFEHLNIEYCMYRKRRQQKDISDIK